MNTAVTGQGRWGTEEDADARRWKANFRCALNSLRDVRELKCCRHGRGRDAYRVYKFLRQRDDVSAVGISLILRNHCLLTLLICGLVGIEIKTC